MNTAADPANSAKKQQLGENRPSIKNGPGIARFRTGARKAGTVSALSPGMNARFLCRLVCGGQVELTVLCEYGLLPACKAAGSGGHPESLFPPRTLGTLACHGTVTNGTSLQTGVWDGEFNDRSRNHRRRLHGLHPF